MTKSLSLNSAHGAGNEDTNKFAMLFYQCLILCVLGKKFTEQNWRWLIFCPPLVSCLCTSTSSNSLLESVTMSLIILLHNSAPLPFSPSSIIVTRSVCPLLINNRLTIWIHNLLRVTWPDMKKSSFKSQSSWMSMKTCSLPIVWASLYYYIAF